MSETAEQAPFEELIRTYGFEVYGNKTPVHDEKGNLYLLEPDTGELTPARGVIVEDKTTFSTPQQKEQQKAWAENEERKRNVRRQSGINGSFVFILKDSYAFQDLSNQTLARLTMLNTYLDYGKDQFYASQKKKQTPMLEQDIKEVLNLTDSTFDRFRKEVKGKYLHKDAQGQIHTDSAYFRRGKIGHSGKSYGKVFIRGFRDLYNRTDSKKHAYLGYLIRMLPYLHLEYNVLCYNPKEKDYAKIDLMNQTELCEELNLEPSRGDRIVKRFHGLIFEANDKRELACMFQRRGPKTSEKYIMVNPRILYSGSRTSWIEPIFQLDAS